MNLSLPKMTFIYFALAFVSLTTASFMNIPALYYPLYISALFLSMFLLKLLEIGLKKWRGKRGASALALTCSLMAVSLQYFLPSYNWTEESPEPIRLWPCWLAVFLGVVVIAAIFSALDGESDRASAITAFIISVIILFLFGYNGTETLMQKCTALSSIIAIVLMIIDKLLCRPVKN